ncbi:MAG: oxidative damage protection protein [Gammaproteobacteria bacterium]|nr:oxidative damage protection protein [Gammaproteobacteria bacterium]
MVSCSVLKTDGPALKAVPYPGELGKRIYNEVSEAGWAKWIENQTMIINENGLSTVDQTSLKMLEKYMVGFLFNEGEMAANGFQPPTK